jgi:mRNA interferase HicA
MKPADLLRRLGRLAIRRAWKLTLAEGARHTKVTLNLRQTVVPRHRADLPSGTLRAILRQLGLTRTDLEME